MKILGHIHTFNDEEVIDRSLQALLDQTRPLDEIVIVDNGSSDSTLERNFPPQVTVIRHKENLGTNGAVISGFKYALEKKYDWIWVFDADSKPHKDALEKLVELYDGFSQEIQEKTRLVASLPRDLTTGNPYHGILYHSKGTTTVQPDPAQTYYEFDVNMWTGTLFKMEAVKKIGIPSPDYFLDWGEFEYGYKGKVSGFKAFMHVTSLVDHNISGHTSMKITKHRFGPFSFTLCELPPIRCYYVVRNMFYFWAYEYQDGSLFSFLPKFLKIFALTINFFIRPTSHWPEAVACLRGLKDGFFKNMHYRY